MPIYYPASNDNITDLLWKANENLLVLLDGEGRESSLEKVEIAKALCNNTALLSIQGLGPPTSAPESLIPPLVYGSAVVGGLLSTTNGTWRYRPQSFTYQWLRDGVDISGATSQNYLLTEDDGGTDVSVRVTATNVIGSTPETSNAVTVTGD